MPTYFLAVFVTLSCLVALRSWRLGLLCTFAAGVLQDPVRKVAPHTPAYLTLAFLPAYFTVFGALWSSTNLLATLNRYFPKMRVPVFLFAVALLASTLQTLSYGDHFIMLALLGVFSYAGALPAVVLGFFLVRRDFRELDPPLVLIAVLTSIMLLGVPLEYSGYKFSKPWLGTIAMKGEWMRWTDAGGVAMISGFYRSPEIMGWHAAVLIMLCVYLMARRPAFTPLWAGLSAWGFSCMLLSGRRKMLLMVCVFLLVFLLFSQSRHRFVLLFCLFVAVVAVGLLLPLLVDDRYVDTAHSTLPGASARLASHALSGPLWLLGEVGLSGFGVGTRTQGSQHLSGEVQVPETEGGLEKVLVELGIGGAIALVLVFLVLARDTWRCFGQARRFGLEQTPLAGALAFVLANAAAFVVAFQIYGDPLVVVVVGLSLGLLLSGARLAAQREALARQARDQRRVSVPASVGGPA